MDNLTYNDLKIYQIDLNFYEFKDYKNNLTAIIHHVIKYHKENFKTNFEVTRSTEEFDKDDSKYTLYTFSEKEKDSIWKDFFPTALIKNNDFTVKSASFVLFIEIGENLFCLIEGKGISVVKRFLNSTFGLDLYERIADPVNDIVYSQNSRGVSGNLSSEQITYRNEQNLIDALTIGRVPKKINLQLRQDIKDSILNFIDFDKDENVCLEIGSSFCIKKKLTFFQLHEIIKKIREILETGIIKPLSRFEKITDSGFIEDVLKPALLLNIRDDMVRLSTESSNLNMLDSDFVHPSKLNQFYECDEYKAFLKGEQKSFFETRDRQMLYKGILKSIYKNVNEEDEFGFRRLIMGVRVKGFNGENKPTEAMFINHITCEITFSKKHYFLIDNSWYTVKGDFIKTINDQCLQLIKRYQLPFSPLEINWVHSELTEGEYNLLYLNRPKYYILDKIIAQNIELCDILYETDDSLYLIVFIRVIVESCEILCFCSVSKPKIM